MKTLKTNYQKNIDILKENLKRGMTKDQADNITNQFKNQFITNNLFNQDEKDFINELKATIISHFTKMEINIIK